MNDPVYSGTFSINGVGDGTLPILGSVATAADLANYELISFADKSCLDVLTCSVTTSGSNIKSTGGSIGTTVISWANNVMPFVETFSI